MFYIINKDTRAEIRTSDTPFNVDETVQPPLPAIQLKRVDNTVPPAYNAATHKLVYSPVDDDVAFTRTFRYVAVLLTAEELAAQQQADADEAQRQTIKAAYAALKAGTGTTVQRLSRIETAVAWLLRDAVK